MNRAFRLLLFQLTEQELIYLQGMRGIGRSVDQCPAISEQNHPCTSRLHRKEIAVGMDLVAGSPPLMAEYFNRHFRRAGRPYLHSISSAQHGGFNCGFP